MSSVLGWLATALSAGVNIDATPVIVANLIVAAMAFYSSFAEQSTWKQ